MGIIKKVSDYELPIATTTELGGVKVDGTTISITSDGVISSLGSGVEISHVEYYANLPAASGHTNEYYFVDKDTIWNKLNPLAKTQGGLYRSDGTSWLSGLIPELAGISDGTNILVDYPVVFSGVTVDNTTKTVTIDTQTDNNFTDTYKTILDNTSGTNTGDETASGIVTKLETLTTTSRLDASAIDDLSLKYNKILTSSYVSLNRGTNTVALTAGAATKYIPETIGADSKSEFNATTNAFTPSFNQYIWIMPTMTVANTADLTFSIYRSGSPYLTYGYTGKAITSTVLLSVNTSFYYEFYITSNVTNTLNVSSRMLLSTQGIS